MRGPSLAQQVAELGRLRERLGAGAAAHGLVLGGQTLGLLHAGRALGLGGYLGRLDRRRLGVLADELWVLAKHGRAQVVRNGGSRVVSVAGGRDILGYSRHL